MSMSRRVAAVLAGLVITAVGLAGCDMNQKSFEDDATEQVAITRIEVRGGSGDIVVHPGDSGKVEIHRKVEYRGQRPAGANHRIEGGVLHLETSCGRTCSTNYTVRAPEGVRVSGRNGSGDLRLTRVSTVDFELASGDVTLRGVNGGVRVRTGSGRIELVDVGGGVTVRTASGDVEGLSLRPTTLDVETASGEVKLELDAPAGIRARTGSGDIRVAVPPGSYRAVTDTDSGEVKVRIATDPAVTNVLDLSTGSGEIAVNPR